MSVALITITHGRIGEDLVTAASQILGTSALPMRHFVFHPEDDPDDVARALRDAVRALDTGAGVLILSDLYGATPCNIADRLTPESHVRVLSGMNLPMVLRVLNYGDRDLDTIARRAAEGGRIGVIECGPTQAGPRQANPKP